MGSGDRWDAPQAITRTAPDAGRHAGLPLHKLPTYTQTTVFPAEAGIQET